MSVVIELEETDAAYLENYLIRQIQKIESGSLKGEDENMLLSIYGNVRTAHENYRKQVKDMYY